MSNYFHNDGGGVADAIDFLLYHDGGSSLPTLATMGIEGLLDRANGLVIGDPDLLVAWRAAAKLGLKR